MINKTKLTLHILELLYLKECLPELSNGYNEIKVSTEFIEVLNATKLFK